MTSDKRNRQKQARNAQRQAKAKKQAQRETFRRIRIALGVGTAVALVLLVTANLGRDEPELPPDYLAYRDQPTACGADPAPEVTLMTFDAPQEVILSSNPVAVIETSCGEITIALDPSGAPETVNSFAFLANEGFYDGTVLHRIVDGFVIQGGDPEASGFGGPGYQLPDEFPEADFVYERGVVAMANAGRGSTGSQFFIVTGAEAAGLSNSFTVIGTVVSGDEALDAITAVPTIAPPGRTERSKPTETVYIESITIE